MRYKDVLEAVFGEEKKKPVIRGRQDKPRRPVRTPSDLGKGYKGKDGQMKGRGQSGELTAPDVPNALLKTPMKKDSITEFDSMEDWLLSMILVAVMHSNPGLTPEEAIDEGKTWVRRLYLPRTNYLWRKQTVRMKQRGIRAEASRIRRELFKLI